MTEEEQAQREVREAEKRVISELQQYQDDYRWLSISIVLVWIAILGFCFYRIWISGLFWTTATAQMSEVNELLSFITIAFLFGALGGLARATLSLYQFIWMVDSSAQTVDVKLNGELERTRRRVLDSSAFNNLFLKPILWPLLGAILGFILALIFLDIATSSPRVALLAFVGGLFAQRFSIMVGKMFGFGQEQDHTQLGY